MEMETPWRRRRWRRWRRRWRRRTRRRWKEEKVGGGGAPNLSNYCFRYFTKQSNTHLPGANHLQPDAVYVLIILEYPTKVSSLW